MRISLSMTSWGDLMLRLFFVVCVIGVCSCLRGQESDLAANVELYEQKLSEETSFEFIQQPLSKVAVTLAKQHGISIKIDPAAVEANPDTPTLPISAGLLKVSLRSALRLMLRTHDLDFVIRDRRVLITTSEIAESTLHDRSYDMPSYVVSSPEPFIQMLQDTALTGEEITEAKLVGQKLMIRARRTLHDRISSLVRQLPQALNQGIVRSRIQKQLDKPANLQYIFSPLDEIIEANRINHRLIIVIDKNSLLEEGIPIDKRITFHLDGVRIGDALQFMLNKYNVALIEQDDVLVVTSKKKADSKMQLGVYWMPPGAEKHMTSVRDLVLKQTGSLWSELGGPNRIAVYKNLFVVTGNHQVQDGMRAYANRMTAVYLNSKNNE